MVRALIAFQAAYNYLDVLAEQPYADPVTGARALHQALLDSLDPALGTESSDYYARYPRREDGGYLAELVHACRTALATLPSYSAVAPATRTATERIVEFQSLNLATGQGDHEAFAGWARAETPPGTDLRWWEAAAAGGSSLGVYALIAAATAPVVDPREVRAIEDAYFPWIGALHSLLDHLVDRGEDAACGQRNLIDYYASPAEAAARLQGLARHAASAARELPESRAHTILLAGMAANYLSEPGAAAPGAAPIAGSVSATIGGLMAPSLLVFKARRLAGRLRRARLERLRGSSSTHPRAVADKRDPAVALRLGR